MKKILVADKMHESITDLLANAGFCCDYQPAIDRKGILSIIDQYEGLFIRSKTPIDQELIFAATKLEFVCRAGAGIDQIDTKLLGRKGIALYNAPEGNRDALGEHAVGMLLSVLHKIHSSDKEIRSKEWRREPNRGIELKNKTVGIYGFGFMGSSFAEKLSGFSCNVIAYDKYKRGFGTAKCREVTLKEFLSLTEILSIHVPLTPETNKLFDYRFISEFKRLKVVMNTARGEVLVLKDLLRLLNEEKLQGAAFDVLENEKFPNYTKEEITVFNELAGKPNVLFTPHVAGWTFESYERINRVLIEKITATNHA